MNEISYRLKPLSPSTAAGLRARGGGRYIADSKPGYPCRECLTDAEIGDALILVSHDPFDAEAETAYRSAGPIFIHEEPCVPATELRRIPDQLRIRQLSVRAFDVDTMMIDADVIDGTDLEAALEGFFADPATSEVHVHNATRGCWATTVVRI